MALFTKEDALNYHSNYRPGKLEVLPVKSCSNQLDLSLAYSPGVAEACKAIKEDPSTADIYTGRANLVGVVSNGTAVLDLGNIGPLAGKPVMEGKAILFKKFADIDVFDINLNCNDPDKIIEIVKAMEPTFGGINLEDIKAPECFYIEQTLIEEMDIPVFHDDQHGTAVISGAGLINAVEISGKKIEDMKVVVSGAGAAGIACSRFYVSLGIDPKNIYMFDSKGLITKDRPNLDKYKGEFAQTKLQTLQECFKDADMFLGLSQKDLVSQDMVKSMNKSPIIFACANPDPEIPFPKAKEARPDCMMGTGRSDYPNQVNNVSGFPYIFRGALDAGAKKINEAMKLAAAKSIADLAKEAVLPEIEAAYNGRKFEYGPDYIIPTPLDPRLLSRCSAAVAQAAIDSGVATKNIGDMEEYKKSLDQRIQKFNARADALIKSYL